MKILMIGNSYTYYNDMPKLLERLANENGRETEVYSVTCGGHSLWQYAELDDEYTRKIAQLIAEHRFDVCILQEQSILPIRNEEKFRHGLFCLAETLKSSVDRFVLYATWGRKDGSETLEEYGWTNAGMTVALDKAYRNAAEALSANVSPVGRNFFAVYTKNPEVELYNADRSHPSYEGSCLAAMTHYRAVFGAMPEETESLNLPGEIDQLFRKTVAAGK